MYLFFNDVLLMVEFIKGWLKIWLLNEYVVEFGNGC